MSKLPRPSAPSRDFEYVSEADEASMRVRLQQHLGATGIFAFAHVVDAVRVLCERSLLPPLTVLDELLAKISPKSKLPEVVSRLKCLTATSSTPTQVDPASSIYRYSWGTHCRVTDVLSSGSSCSPDEVFAACARHSSECDARCRQHPSEACPQ